MGGGVKSFSCETQPVRLRLGWDFDNIAIFTSARIFLL